VRFFLREKGALLTCTFSFIQFSVFLRPGRPRATHENRLDSARPVTAYFCVKTYGLHVYSSKERKRVPGENLIQPQHDWRDETEEREDEYEEKKNAVALEEILDSPKTVGQHREEHF